MKIRHTKRNGGKEVWELDIGMVEGRRRRLFFKTEKAAKLKSLEIKSDFEAAGRRWINGGTPQKAKVIYILEEISQRGLTLEQVWEAYKSGKIAHHHSGKKISVAIEEVLAVKTASNLRPKYLSELKRYLKLFARGKDSMDVGQLGVAEIEAWFADAKNPLLQEWAILANSPPCSITVGGAATSRKILAFGLRSRMSKLAYRKFFPLSNANA